jgi:hypothetical protein
MPDGGLSDLVSDFLDQVAAEIDAVLGWRELGAPATGTAADALLAVNADGALLVALAATYPESSGPSSADEVIKTVQERYDLAMTELVQGTHPAILLLEAGAVNARATSFWEQEPLYGEFYTDPNLSPFSPDANPNNAPRITRGQSF